MMRGRCYGCGSRNHRKADGHHERDVCRYCGLTGHLENVCRRKFLGLGKKTVQRVAATDSMVSTPVAPTPNAPTADFTNVLQQLVANQQALATSIRKMDYKKDPKAYEDAVKALQKMTDEYAALTGNWAGSTFSASGSPGH